MSNIHDERSNKSIPRGTTHQQKLTTSPHRRHTAVAFLVDGHHHTLLAQFCLKLCDVGLLVVISGRMMCRIQKGRSCTISATIKMPVQWSVVKHFWVDSRVAIFANHRLAWTTSRLWQKLGVGSGRRCWDMVGARHPSTCSR